MNSYQTLNAAARISGLAVRHAVAFGQEWQRRHEKDTSLRLGIAATKRFVGKWNDEDKERQLAIKRLTEAMAAGSLPFEQVAQVHDSLVYERTRGATIPRRDYADKVPGRYQVVYQEDSGDEFREQPWKVYDTKQNPSMRGINGRQSFSKATEATEAAVRQEEQA